MIAFQFIELYLSMYNSWNLIQLKMAINDVIEMNEEGKNENVFDVSTSFEDSGVSSMGDKSGDIQEKIVVDKIETIQEWKLKEKASEKY